MDLQFKIFETLKNLVFDVLTWCDSWQLCWSLGYSMTWKLYKRFLLYYVQCATTDYLFMKCNELFYYLVASIVLLGQRQQRQRSKNKYKPK